jgi:hypothetical protein
MGPAAARRLGELRIGRTLPSPTAWTVTGVGVTGFVALIASTSGGAHPYEWVFAPTRELSSRLDGRLPRSETVLVSVQVPEPFDAFTLTTAMVYQLRRSGHRVVTEDGLALNDKFGPSYAARRHPPSSTLYLTQGVAPPAVAGGRVLARIPVPARSRGTPAGTIVATIAPSTNR